MNEEIGTAAGEIWQVLDSQGEMSLAQLKKEVTAKAPVVDWALGWLARENKLEITREKRGYRARLK